MSREWLKHCKQCNMNPEQFLSMVLEYAQDDKKKAELFKYVYTEKQLNNPEKSCSEIKKEMIETFQVTQNTLEKYIYWK